MYSIFRAENAVTVFLKECSKFAVVDCGSGKIKTGEAVPLFLREGGITFDCIMYNIDFIVYIMLM